MRSRSSASRRSAVFGLLAVLAGVVVWVAPPARGRAQTSEPQLTNLTEVSSARQAIRIGKRLCPEQHYFQYTGGTADNFGGAPDPAYPSVELAALSGTQPLRVDYDAQMVDDWFGDSFNLQNRRQVCHAAMRVRLDENGGLAPNDGLHVGHVASGVFSTQAAMVYFPGAPGPAPETRVWAFDTNGINALSTITSAADPNDAILDVYLQDDTSIDHVTLWIWYEP